MQIDFPQRRASSYLAITCPWLSYQALRKAYFVSVEPSEICADADKEKYPEQENYYFMILIVYNNSQDE